MGRRIQSLMCILPVTVSFLCPIGCQAVSTEPVQIQVLDSDGLAPLPYASVRISVLPPIAVLGASPFHREPDLGWIELNDNGIAVIYVPVSKEHASTLLIEHDGYASDVLQLGPFASSKNVPTECVQIMLERQPR